MSDSLWKFGDPDKDDLNLPPREKETERESLERVKRAHKFEREFRGLWRSLVTLLIFCGIFAHFATGPVFFAWKEENSYGLLCLFWILALICFGIGEWRAGGGRLQEYIEKREREWKCRC